MDRAIDEDWLVATRRDLHRRPEPAWREFYTTARIVDELESIGVDELHVGPDAIDAEARAGVPDEAELATWLDRAREATDRTDVLDRLAHGQTGAVAVLHRGDGPTVGLRVDIDGLPREESDDDDHLPVAEGFRSRNPGAMHACGHDAHATIGLGVVEAIDRSAFSGTLKVCFQPAEEAIAGGKPMVDRGHLDDVDYLLAMHVGLDHPTGTIVAGVDGFLAITEFRAQYTGEAAHAAQPHKGRHAIHALATAVDNLLGIARHADGPTRVNVGEVGGGTASNIIPEAAFMLGEVRGETTALREHMWKRATTVIEHAGAMHGCSTDVEVLGEAPSARSDDALVDLVADVAADRPSVTEVINRDRLDGSEDATYLMRHVQDRGGLAAYVGIGADSPGGHHMATFDVDERALPIGVDLLVESIERIARDRP